MQRLCMEEIKESMLIKIKMTKGNSYVGKVPSKDIDEVLKVIGYGFFKIDHSTGPILINVANIDSITRAQ